MPTVSFNCICEISNCSRRRRRRSSSSSSSQVYNLVVKFF